jgi:arabinose-5-phosphate isomerase
VNSKLPNLIITSALKTLQLQADSILQLIPFVGESLVTAVELVAGCKGRVVISGIGKSAIVAQKIVATMNSTGTPALFMHAADAIHGDLGMIQQEDIVIVISKSGDSPEIKVLAPLVKNFGNKLIGMVGNMQSYLAAHADIVINTTVSHEACPNNLAPTTSTTAQMVMGDVLAICLIEVKGFKTVDFARFHPGGALGKRMYLKCGDLIKLHEKPFVAEEDSIKKVIVEISKKRLGATAILNKNDEPIGIVTDGDIRRMFENYDDFNKLNASDIMTSHAKQIAADALAVEALQLMKTHNISQLLVIENNKYVGMLHLHDLIKEGII